MMTLGPESYQALSAGSEEILLRQNTVGGGEDEAGKRFYLQYNFPPSCVGETGRVGAVGRREAGHGMLAERALSPIIPSEARPSYIDPKP